MGYRKNGKKIDSVFKKHFEFKGNDFTVGWKRFVDDEDDDDEKEEGVEMIWNVIKNVMDEQKLDFDSVDVRQRFVSEIVFKEERTALLQGVTEEEIEGDDDDALPQNTNDNTMMTPAGMRSIDTDDLCSNDQLLSADSIHGMIEMDEIHR